MANFLFRYGAMNSGKSTHLMQVAYNYEENGRKVALLKSTIDTKGNDCLVSRIGLKRKVDYLVSPEASILNLLEPCLSTLSCILVDEVNFMMPSQVEELYLITKCYDVPVICYGLRTDFQTKGFPGSVRCFELADELEELPTICACGRKARLNARKLNGSYVLEGESFEIDGADPKLTYEPVCGTCYVKKVWKK